MKQRKHLVHGIVCLALISLVATNAASQGTVTDSLTGLMWEQADNQQWLNWYEACDYCDNLTLGGHADWRLPEMAELRTIVDYTTIDMALEPLYKGYSAFKSQIYWSNTEYIGYGEPPLLYSWVVSFYGGATHPRYKTNSHSVRCVRGTPYVPFEPVVESEGVIRDTVSNLLWQNNEVVVQNWENASLYCENLTLGGYEDWRLPNYDELQSIIDYSAYRPAVHEIFRGNTPNSTFWTKTPYAQSAYHYWGVNFETGSISGNSQQNREETANCVRCVQGEEIIIEPSELECDPGVYSSLSVSLKNALTGDSMTDLAVEVDGQTATTDSQGIVEFNFLRRPTATVHIQREGFVDVNQEVAIVCGEANSITIAVLPLDEGALRGDIRFILTWGDEPPDLDSHMTGPEAGGGNFHVYYGNRNSADGRVGLDVDDTSSYGPETITVRKTNGAYTAGDYLYYIYNFTGSPSITSQRQYISAVVYQGTEMIGVFQPPRAEDMNIGLTWNVVSMNITASGLVTFSVASTAGNPRVDPTPHGYDFGTVYLESNELTPGIVNISNLGTGNLNVTEILLSDTENFSFGTSCGSTSPIIGPGSVCSMSILFNPKRTGQFDEFLTIMSNDQFFPTLTIPITATVISNLATIPTSQIMPVGSTVTFKIIGGTPPYAVESPNENSALATLVQSGVGETYASTLEVTSVLFGNLPIKVTDNNGNYTQAWVDMRETLSLWAYFTATPMLGYDAPMSVQFTNESTADSGITSYAWDFGDGGTSSEENPVHSYTEEGIYTVSLTITAQDVETITRQDLITVRGRGDLNCDGNVDLADVILAMDEQLYDNLLQTLCFEDYDEDDKIGLGEVLYIMQKVAGVR